MRFRKFCSTKLTAPPPAVVPDAEEDSLFAEVFGVDDASFFHIGFSDKKALDLFEEMHSQMLAFVNERELNQLISPQDLRDPENFFIVKHGGRRCGVYSRAKVVEAIPGTDKASLILIDDFLEVEVPTTDIYPINEKILSFPLFALKCRLEHLDTFIGYPFLKTVYNVFKEGERRAGVRCSVVEVEVVNTSRKPPVLRLKTAKGVDLTSILQKLMPSVSAMEYPTPNVPTKANIINCNKLGKVWFQTHGETELIRLIEHRLEIFKFGGLKVNIDASQVDTASWKNYYFTGPGELYMAVHSDDNDVYRVRLLERYWNYTAEVYFIDYGFRATVCEDTLVPLHWVDPNLSFIAPQCLALKMIGTDENNVGNPFNTVRFWKYVNLQPVNIIVKDYGIDKLSKRFRGLIVPEGDILVRHKRTPINARGYSLHKILNDISLALGNRSGSLNSTAGFRQRDNTDADSPVDSAFESLGREGDDTEGEDDSSSDLEGVSKKPVTTLPSTYYRHLRLVNTRDLKE